MTRSTPTTPPDTGPRVVLDLSTRPVPDIIRIDGRAHELRPLGMLSLNERYELGRRFERLRALEAKPKRTDKDETEYRRRIRDLCAMALPDAAAADLDKVPLDQQEELVALFFVKTVGRRGAVLAQLGASATRSPSTRETSRPTSRRSTAAARATG